MEQVYMESYRIPMHQIDQNLFLGNRSAANNLELLNQHHITSLVQAISAATQVKIHPDFTYHRFIIDDIPSANILMHLPATLNFIHTNLLAGNALLIHCEAGISRSSSIAVAYFMARYEISYDEALYRIRLCRLCASPNEGFEQQIRSLSSSLLKSYLTL